MPTIRDHHSKKIFRGMLMGDPGCGKTGSLISLIQERKRFGIERFLFLDWDDGMDIIAAHLNEEDAGCVYYETLRDVLKATQVGVVIKDACAFPRGMALLNNWKQPAHSIDLGPSGRWGSETVLINDTITGLGDAAMNFAKSSENIEDDWRATGAGMRLQDKLVQMLVTLNCHIIVNSHVRYMGGGGRRQEVSKDGTVKAIKEVDSNIDGQAYPSALGRVLPPTLGRHFNTILEIKLVGKYRKIRTVPEDRMNLKIPFKIRDELPQETGMVEVFDKFLNR